MSRERAPYRRAGGVLTCVGVALVVGGGCTPADPAGPDRTTATIVDKGAGKVVTAGPGRDLDPVMRRFPLLAQTGRSTAGSRGRSAPRPVRRSGSPGPRRTGSTRSSTWGPSRSPRGSGSTTRLRWRRRIRWPSSCGISCSRASSSAVAASTMRSPRRGGMRGCTCHRRQAASSSSESGTDLRKVTSRGKQAGADGGLGRIPGVRRPTTRSGQ